VQRIRNVLIPPADVCQYNTVAASAAALVDSGYGYAGFSRTTATRTRSVGGGTDRRRPAPKALSSSACAAYTITKIARVKCRAASRATTTSAGTGASQRTQIGVTIPGLILTTTAAERPEHAEAAGTTIPRCGLGSSRPGHTTCADNDRNNRPGCD
jgi:hypothetical protein